MTHSVTEAEARQVAETFGVAVQSVHRVSGGFSGSAVFRAECSSGQNLAIRNTPVDHAASDDRHDEWVHLLEYVRGSGLTFVTSPMRCGVPLHANLLTKQSPYFVASPSTGATRVRMGDSFWQIEAWMPGNSIDEAPTSLQLQSAMQALVKFYETTRAAVSSQQSSGWFYRGHGKSPGVHRRLSIARNLLSGQLQQLRSAQSLEPHSEFRNLSLQVCGILERRLPWLISCLTTVADQPFVLQPVIRDLWRPHLLFTGNQLTGLIDLSSMSTDHYCLDLSRLFRSWYGANLKSIVEAIDVFASEQALDHSERSLMRAVDAASVLLSPITWIRRRLESGKGTSISNDVLARFEEVVRIAEAFEPL